MCFRTHAPCLSPKQQKLVILSGAPEERGGAVEGPRGRARRSLCKLSRRIRSAHPGVRGPSNALLPRSAQDDTARKSGRRPAWQTSPFPEARRVGKTLAQGNALGGLPESLRAEGAR